MKTTKRSKLIRARTTAAVPAEPKTTFPETLLRQTDGVRKAGLPCVKRMPSYLQMLRVLQAEGQEHVSGTVLASVHNLEPVIVRKDLAMTGAVGTPRIGFRITELIATFDRDPKVIGKWVHGRKVQGMDQLIPFVRRGEILLGVLTVPAEEAQATAELMVRAGLKGIWNFTPAKLQLPDTVVTQKEDLAEGLAVLSHRLHQLHGEGTL